VALCRRHWTISCGAESRTVRAGERLLDTVVCRVQGGESLLDLNHDPCSVLLDFNVIDGIDIDCI
jgi:hypothetical protein